MGHHYVPQRYLKNFEATDRPAFVRQYDKITRSAKWLHIKSVAQAKEYYTQEMEQHLANEVEPQGSAAIEKVIRGEGFSLQERMDLGIYLGATMKRVPAHRKRVNAMVPETFEAILSEFREQVYALSESDQIDPDLAIRRLREADEVEERFLVDGLPESVQHQISNPLPSPEIVAAIASMYWRIMISIGPQYFITSDNPFFFTTGYGLANMESEFFLPLSPRVLLHGSWKSTSRALPKSEVPQRIVRSINKKMVLEAERFVFAHEEASWLPRLLELKEHSEFNLTWKGRRLF